MLTDRKWPAFFRLAPDGQYVPLPLALSYWSTELISGPPVCGIIARELEQACPAGGFIPARLTVDLSHPVPATPLTVCVRVVRESRRLRSASADVLADGGKVVASADLMFLRQGEQPPGVRWSEQRARPVPAAGAPGPDVTPVYGSGDAWSGDIRAFGDAHRKRVWVRRIAAVDGEKPSPFVSAAIVGEQASFVTNWGTNGIEFINIDVTLNLARLPCDSELGVEADSHLSDSGIAVGAATLYDRRGPVGVCTVSSLANAQKRILT